MPSAMLIALEGIDGAGKRTQAARLKERAEAAGLRTALISFPRYEQTLAAAAIQDYLSGRLGDIASVPPRFTAAMYALDRFESRDGLERLRASHDLVIADRYVASNLAYQGARVDEASREDFVRWVYELEHRVLGLPKPDLTVYLDVPVDLAARRIGHRRQAGQAALEQDIYEGALAYLEQCRRTYRFVARLGLYDPWLDVDVARSGMTAGPEPAATGEPGRAAAAAGEAAPPHPDALAERIWRALAPYLPGRPV